MKTVGIHRSRIGLSVGSKLFIAFFAGIVAFVCLVGGLSYEISVDIITKQARSSFNETIDKTGDNVELTLEGVANASKKLAVDKTFAQGVQRLGDSTDVAERTKLMTSIMDGLRTTKAESNVIGAIAVLYPGGGVYSEGRGVASDAYSAKWVERAEQANGQPVWLAPEKAGDGFVKFNDSFAPEPGILLARLLRNPVSGEDVGVLAFEVKLKALSDRLGGVEGAELFIADASSRYVYAADPAEQGKDIGYGELKPGASEVRGESGRELLADRPLNGTEWSLVGTVPLSRLTKDTVRIAEVTIAAAAAAALFAALVGWAVVRMIARPLTRMAQLMESAAGGDLTGRAATDVRRDEIGKLSRHFNEMMASMGQLIKETVESAGAVHKTASSVEAASRNNADSASQIVISARGISEGATALAADAERGVEIADRMMANVERVVDSNGRMEGKAREASRAGEDGKLHMKRLSAVTGRVEEANVAMNGKMTTLHAQTSSVTELLDQLHRLARQTNILSLNASIEASRAGASGKGFQIIAREMGALAKQSETHLGRVAEWMGSMTGDIQGATEEMSRANALFGEQFRAIADTETLFSGIVLRMEEFAASLEEAGESVRDMASAQRSLQETIMSVGAVSEQSTASVQEVAAMTGEQERISADLAAHARELAALSDRLRSQLVRFEVRS